ncbi:MAG: IclR family transcriptional regulator domain-containing protein [Desulfotomaculales bacterium]
MTNVDKLKENLKQVVQRGYAVSCEEHTPGVVGIAALIFDLNGKVKMIIACLGVAAYMDEEKIAAYGEKVKEIALEITRALGGQKSKEQLILQRKFNLEP